MLKPILMLCAGLTCVSAISGCAATAQTGRYANAGCGPAACAPATPAAQSRYGAPITQDCCYAPPMPQIMYVDRVKTVQVEKPVYVDREKIVKVEVEVEKPVYIDKPVYIEVPVGYPEPPCHTHTCDGTPRPHRK